MGITTFVFIEKYKIKRNKKFNNLKFPSFLGHVGAVD